MKRSKGEFILIIIKSFFFVLSTLFAVLLLCAGIMFKIWNCDRVGMDFDFFVKGCVVRQND